LKQDTCPSRDAPIHLFGRDLKVRGEPLMSDYIALANPDLPAQPTPGTLDGPPLSAPGWPGRALESVAVWVVLLLAWSVASVYLPLGDNPLLPSPLITARALRESLPELWAGSR
jgi:NitT/TauT family transport system permease protein